MAQHTTTTTLEKEGTDTNTNKHINTHKSTVLTSDDLPQLLGKAFEGKRGQSFGRWLLKRVQVDKINEVNARHCHLGGADFAAAVLADHDIDVQYTVHGREHLDSMRDPGAFITVSNHPFGAIDGLILIDLIGHIRHDFKMVVNNFLGLIDALDESFITVEPYKSKQNYVHNSAENFSALKRMGMHLYNGAPLGLFPAGGIAKRNFRTGERLEQPWLPSSLRIIRRTKVPVYPIYIDGSNSLTYHLLTTLSYNLTVLRIPAEIFNKRGQIINIYCGAPIMPEEIDKYKKTDDLRQFLMNKTLNLPTLA